MKSFTPQLTNWLSASCSQYRSCFVAVHAESLDGGRQLLDCRCRLSVHLSCNSRYQADPKICDHINCTSPCSLQCSRPALCRTILSRIRIPVAGFIGFGHQPRSDKLRLLMLCKANSRRTCPCCCFDVVVVRGSRDTRFLAFD